jgi:thioredoxin 1
VPAVTDADFDGVVLGTGDVLVDFWAPWCTPCAKVTPVMEALAAEHADSLRVVALDVEANPGAAARHAVLDLPTVILFRDGAEVARITGSPSEKRIRKALSPHLG